MKTDLIVFILELVIIFTALFSIIYTFGVVWRVEKKLDLSYKLILSAIIAFTLSEIISIMQIKNGEWLIFLVLILKTIFILLFLFGILEMRYLIRKLDGELKNTSK
ncbi:MAG: hypothetical protein COX30_01285 [Candidatus Moranbacteria bacterium CG23_combo_of_CG06-09_8_20_14_all_39_10]|nr:MAG: hypothetical protein COX30_01285 [Candidatus Moranbacteria bacterium CG23_combo_of_CG06-09_8_20_14_all_39_10]